MEEYKDIENDASTTTAVGHEGTLHQALQRQLEGEAERNLLANIRVLKAKWECDKTAEDQARHAGSHSGSKNAEAAIKQIATQELLCKK